MAKGIIRKIRQLDIDTGEEIEVYPTLKAAAYDNYTNEKEIRRALEKSNGVMQRKQIRFEYVS